MFNETHDSSLWTTEFDWPFKQPPTRDLLITQGADPENWHLLALNESPWSPTETATEYLQKALPYLNRYPGNVHAELVKAVSEHLEVSAELQVWGNGIGELINRVIAVAARHNLEVISPSPTFWGYERIYRLQDAIVTRTHLRPDGTMDVEAFLSAIGDNTGIVTFANPGNPSGITLSEDEIIEIARKTPEHILLMVDEAYHEFCVHEGGPDALKIMRQERRGPWIILRSFSKAYRLAGARVGYGLVSDAQTAKRIREQALVFTTSSLSFAAAFAAWCDQESMHAYLNHNRSEKGALSAALSTIGLDVLPSAANFISACLPIHVSEVLPLLRERKIACAQWNHKDFPNYIRIGIGTESNRIAVVEALQDILP